MAELEGKSISEVREICDVKGVTYTSKDSKVRLIAKLKKLELGDTQELTGEEEISLTFDEQRTLLELQLDVVEKRKRAEIERLEHALHIEEKRFELEEKKREHELKFQQASQGLLPPKTNANNSRMFKLRDMKEGEDVEDYFQIFERTALAINLPKEQWVGNLCQRLNDKSRTVFLELTDDEIKDFEIVKVKILDAHQLTAEHYRVKFRQSQKRSDEDFSLWARRTRRYLNSWMRAAEATDYDEILDQITIEKLVDSVSPSLQISLKEKKITTVEEFGKFANVFVQARKGPIIDGKYANSNSSNMRVNKSENDKVKSVFNGISTDSPQRVESKTVKPQLSKSKVKCYNCQQLGHYASSCTLPDQRKLGTKGTATGLLCLTPLESDLPLSDFSVGYVNGKEARLIVDSGCTRTLVHRRFVPTEFERGNTILAVLANGKSLEIPLAKVQIKKGNKSFTETVGVVDDLPVDCLLGRSSYGKSLKREDIIKHWENVTGEHEEIGSNAFVVTRSQALKNAAQNRLDELIDRENEMMLKGPVRVRDSDEEIPVESNDLKSLFLQDASADEDETVKLLEPEAVSNTSTEQFQEVQNSNETKLDLPREFENILVRDRKQLILDQQNDPNLKSLQIINKLTKDSEGYYYDNGLLLNRRIISGRDDINKIVDRVVVPQPFRQEILRIAHSIPIAGHMGIAKTRSRIEPHFFWPGFYSDIRTFCQVCPQCQLVARKRKAERAPLQPVPVVSVPFAKVAIDLIGELTRSKSGYKYILTLVDYATRYPEAIPLKTAYSREIADALITIFSRVGIPQELVSDQGQNFIGCLMTQLYKQLGITKIKTSVYHPEANGLVERFNGTLKSMLRKISDDIKNWDKYLPYLLFAYREVPSSSTGFSPFELLYGHSIRGPLAVVKESWITGKSEDPDMVKYVLDMRRRMSHMHDVARENKLIAQAQQKKYFDKNSSVRNFEVGDKVLVLLPTPGNKLETKWHGPYEIVEKSATSRNFKVDTKRKKKRFRVYNIGLLRKWQENCESTAFAAIPSEISDNLTFDDASFSSVDKSETWEDIQINPDLASDQIDAIRDLLQEFADVFGGDPSQTNAVFHEIDTGDSRPIRSSPYRVPKSLEKEYYAEIEYMLQHGIIRPSKSAWASPVVIVPKTDGKIRFCVDYRRLNNITKMDAFPMPRSDQIIERVASSFFISTLDLTKGYWQIPLHPNSIEKSAFITPENLYEFLVMPFGLKTACASFQRMMKTKVLQNLEEVTDAYIDDVEIDTITFPDHLVYLRKVMERLRKFNLKAKPSKCKIAMSTVNFVGHRVGSNSIQPQSVLTSVINDFPQPKTKKEVRSFLGLVGFYRKYIPNFAQRASSLTDLTRGKLATITWSPSCQAAFNSLKQELQKSPVLAPPCWNKIFIVQVDASNRGIGAVLAQRDSNEDEHPICFLSRKLRRSEEILSTTEKECLGLVWALCTLRYYLIGRKFQVEVDHNPLVWLDRVKEKSQKLLRWSLTLQEFDFTVRYKKGTAHSNADALSRQ